jgi:hypothetical protein
MDSVVVKCAFCLARHVIDLDGIETWSYRAAAGASGSSRMTRISWRTGTVALAYT